MYLLATRSTIISRWRSPLVGFRRRRRAVVMLENIVRHMEEGKGRLEPR